MSDDDKDERASPRQKRQKRLNRNMLFKLTLVVILMSGFGYAMVPMYKSICEALGVNVIARGDVGAAYGKKASDLNTQVDLKRDVVVEFDANVRGPWEFHPEQNTVTVHPGQLTTVMYEFRNTQSRTMTAQAIPSYAPGVAQAHFTKVECFCFNQQTLAPGESKRWPVIFVVDDKLPKDVKTITLSYTFFEVGGTTPPAPVGQLETKPHV
ncbi:MAG: cytochrome c oxidase assembly protein [Burkholderiaceae bacterium]|jgi:cytochrome c oxidase assembly protein subunit 11